MLRTAMGRNAGSVRSLLQQKSMRDCLIEAQLAGNLFPCVAKQRKKPTGRHSLGCSPFEGIGPLRGLLLVARDNRDMRCLNLRVYLCGTQSKSVYYRLHFARDSNFKSEWK